MPRAALPIKRVAAPAPYSFSKKEVPIAGNPRDPKRQRAVLQGFKPENDFEVREALQETGRQDLIGRWCDALIPAHPPIEALRAHRERTNQNIRGDHDHTIPRPPREHGDRPRRKTARRRPT